MAYQEEMYAMNTSFFYLLLSVILRNIWTLLKAVQTEKGTSGMRAYEFAEELKKEVFTAYGAS